MKHAIKTLLALSLIVAIPVCLSGCVVAGIALIKAASPGGGAHTATVEIEAEPDDVYAAMLRVVDEDPDVTLVKRDDVKHTVEASAGKSGLTASADLQDNGKTMLTVVARAKGKDVKSKDLAASLVEKVCDELGVPHRTEEQ